MVSAAVAVAVAAAVAAVAHTALPDPCQQLQERASVRRGVRELLVLHDGSEGALAAAALLRAALLAGGYRARLRPHCGGLCALLAARPRHLMLAPSVVWRGERCRFSGGGLRVLGAGVVPPQLHARLAPAALRECRNRTLESALRECEERELADAAATNVTRLELRASVERCVSSFDAQLRDGDESVAPFAASLSVATEAPPVAAQPAFDELARFRPTPRELRAALEGADDESAAAVERSACRLALAGPPPAAATKILSHRALVVACDESLVSALPPTEARIANLTDRSDVRIEFAYETAAASCADRDWLARAIVHHASAGRLATFVGAIAPAALAERAEAAAAFHRVPVVSYEPAARAPSTAGSAAALGAALLRAAAACGWRRLGVLHGPDALDEAAARALGAAPDFTVRSEALAEGAGLAALLAADARVLVVLAGAAQTARVLERAHELNATRARGYVWLVRALDTTPPSGIRPLLLTFDPGLRPAPPLRPLADAMLVLAAALQRLLDERPDLRDAAHEREDYLTLFWRGERNQNVRVHATVPLLGREVPRVFSFNETVGVVDPVAFVRAWDERQDDWGEPAPENACALAAPPHDGSRRCSAPVGDAFAPACVDHLAGAALALAALARALWALGAAALRRRLRARERRVAAGFCERMLARHPGAWAALRDRVVDRGALQWRRALGSGRSGRVSLAVLRARPPLPVAVKQLLLGADAAEEAEFVREASALASLRHEHVVRFVGVCVAGGPPLLLMEHAFFGDLRRYLRERRHLAEAAAGGSDGGEEAAHVSAAALTRLAREAASALAHLAERALVHRDVRAANCLVDARRRLKLADFGMARATDDGEYSCRRRALFPVLWMAPEAVARGVATAATDVWALGVLALELVSLGARPWGARAACEAAAALRAGARPPLPADAGAGARALTAACWRRAPGRRPSARALEAWLARRPRALRPALGPLERDPLEDADSGFGEPRALDPDD